MSRLLPGLLDLLRLLPGLFDLLRFFPGLLDLLRDGDLLLDRILSIFLGFPFAQSGGLVIGVGALVDFRSGFRLVAGECFSVLARRQFHFEQAPSDSSSSSSVQHEIVCGGPGLW